MRGGVHVPPRKCEGQSASCKSLFFPSAMQTQVSSAGFHNWNCIPRSKILPAENISKVFRNCSVDRAQEPSYSKWVLRRYVIAIGQVVPRSSHQAYEC